MSTGFRTPRAILMEYDTKINELGDYPAKDIINGLTKLAEDITMAEHIVDFLIKKILLVSPRRKLPIFYLIDSILKNIGGKYVHLFTPRITSTFSQCVAEVQGKDLKRFLHVLETWGKTRLFSSTNIVAMRQAVQDAIIHDPSAQSGEPISFSKAPPSKINIQQPVGVHPGQISFVGRTGDDMQLRMLLTQLQTDMNLHPTKHMTLEEVRANNPEFYEQLLAYRDSQASAAVEFTKPTNPSRNPSLETFSMNQRPSSPRRFRNEDHAFMGVVATGKSGTVGLGGAPGGGNGGRNGGGPGGSGNGGGPGGGSGGTIVRPKASSSPRRGRSPPSRGPSPSVIPDAGAVLSILQKLKGMPGSTTTATATATVLPPPTPASVRDELQPLKDRVEVNIQLLYAARPLVCQQSGLRFKKQDKLDSHLDFLFQYNQAKRDRSKGATSRAWCPNLDQWASDFKLVGIGGENVGSYFDLKAQEEVTEDVEESSVPVDESITKCRICGESLVKYWDEEEEEWMYKDAIVGSIDTPDGSMQKSIFHKKCYQSAVKNGRAILASQLIPGTPSSPFKMSNDGGASWKEGGKLTDHLNDVNASATTGEKRRIKEEPKEVDLDSKRQKVDDAEEPI